LAARANQVDLARDLVQTREDGRIKLFVTFRALTCRRDNPNLFSSGEYVPLEVTGPRQAHAFAFLRRLGDTAAVCVVPRLLTRLTSQPGGLPLGKEVWQDTVVNLPGSELGRRLVNRFTGERLTLAGEGGRIGLRLGEIFAHFPVALLTRSG
jgi:(1->4)-alpha-D-glucan 1-alpha-D-glucosylmutase